MMIFDIYRRYYYDYYYWGATYADQYYCAATYGRSVLLGRDVQKAPGILIPTAVSP